MPVQLYVRISNRLVGDYVMTQNNIGMPRAKPDSIAVGDWSLDEHMTGKYAVPDGKGGHVVTLEGNFWPSIPSNTSGGNWYDVPYRIMVPKRGTGTNLLVPVALSASAVAFSSTRIENMLMSVGSAAGVAAAQVAAGAAATVQDVDVAAVQKILADTFRQRIHGPPGRAPHPPPPKGPAFYSVSGAGSAEWNGKYVPGGGPYGGYHSTTCATCFLYAMDGVWRFGIVGKELMYEATERSPLPPLAPAGWKIKDCMERGPDLLRVGPCHGIAPAPSLKAGPAQ